MKLIYNKINIGEDFKQIEEIYLKDKITAGILVRNNPKYYFKTEDSIIDWEDGNFSIITNRIEFCMSVTNKKYYKKDVITKIAIKKDKWYKLVDGKKIKTLVYCSFNDIPSYAVNWVIEKYPFLRYVNENNIFKTNSIYTIIKNKLYNPTKWWKFHYKVNAKLAQQINKNVDLHTWKSYLKDNVLINIENFNIDLLNSENHYIFYDTIRIAKILQKKVNCSWKSKRLKTEHDEWSKELTDIVFIATNRDLKINSVFETVEKVIPELKLLRTTKELAIEGRDKQHCVASYGSIVDGGRAAIYSVSDYTLELVMDYNNKVSIKQFRGLRNINAPIELYTDVSNKLLALNNA